MTESRHPGHYVREARIRLFGEHSQVEAAAAADISQPYLSQIERGVRPLTGNMAIKMEQGWELEPYELVRWSKAGTATLAAATSDGVAGPGYLRCLIWPLFPARTPHTLARMSQLSPLPVTVAA